MLQSRVAPHFNSRQETKANLKSQGEEGSMNRNSRGAPSDFKAAKKETSAQETRRFRHYTGEEPFCAWKLPYALASQSFFTSYFAAKSFEFAHDWKSNWLPYCLNTGRASLPGVVSKNQTTTLRKGRDRLNVGGSCALFLSADSGVPSR
ncbi:hypothetical protein VTI74DRAFT_872 [Chaetomium olivicolor]